MAYRLESELQGAEIKEPWTKEERDEAKKDLYTEEEIRRMETAECQQ